MTIDLTAVTVRTILREREPDAGVNFRFGRLDANEDEVMSLFHSHAQLQVVLLTESGGQKFPIEGIVTQWDAARFTPEHDTPSRS